VDALATIMTRRSIRTYDTEPVESRAVGILLRAAMAAPSAGNQQPWRFVVVTERTPWSCAGRPRGSVIRATGSRTARRRCRTGDRGYRTSCGAATARRPLSRGVRTPRALVGDATGSKSGPPGGAARSSILMSVSHTPRRPTSCGHLSRPSASFLRGRCSCARSSRSGGTSRMRSSGSCARPSCAGG